ncbi:TetR/AcrR family transcriptional regulator [Streptomyces johnsoniae]|uniref:TetR/AcrR family transcriptional regulator n=1 Tax=Streptomyces johnsoniae TaxID=3075532 RepID=A0ABU2RY05_9ACTN|nr:TetR/AcrR family transcriptional regulator [Streptomyces sp. DSM 41886]MDT0441639.1 TetR/AcrR family transcriptional regulator [Streptomyces sp. DSM 41886]
MGTGSRDIERTIDLLWRTGEPGTRGPRGSLTVDRIVATAIEIADAEGIGGVSMRKIAERLGVTTMSLYRYVPGKEDLLDLMFEMATGMPDTDAWPDDWRGRLTAYAVDSRAMLLERPWMADIPLSGPPMGPNNLTWMEAVLSALDGTGLRDEDMAGMLMLLASFVLHDVQRQLSMTRAVPHTGFSYEEWGEVYGRTLTARADPARFPTVSRVAATGVFSAEAATADEDFLYGITFVLDGIDSLIQTRNGGA